MTWLHEKLLALKQAEWREVDNIYRYTNVTPEMWENYTYLFDKPELSEHIQMVEAQRLLKRAWAAIRKEYRQRVKAASKGANKKKAGGHDQGCDQGVPGESGVESQDHARERVPTRDS